MSEHDPIDWDELDAETQHELVSLAEKLGEESGQSGGRTASRREFLGAITAAGLGGSLLSQGADRAFEDFVNPASAGTQSVAQFGEAGEPFDFVAEDIYGPGGQGSGDAVNLESFSAGGKVLADYEGKYGRDAVAGILASDDGEALITQNRDNSGTLSEQRSRWVGVDDNVDRIGSMVWDAGDNEYSIYTRTSALGDGTNDLTKRLDIKAGSQNANVRWENVDRYKFLDCDVEYRRDGAELRFDVPNGIKLKTDVAGDPGWSFVDDNKSPSFIFLYNSNDNEIRVGRGSGVDFVIHTDNLEFQNGAVANYDVQDVRNISPLDSGMVAYHDGSGTNTAGPAHYNGVDWISTVDGSTIS